MKIRFFIILTISILIMGCAPTGFGGIVTPPSAPNCQWINSEITFSNMELDVNPSCSCNYGAGLLFPFYDLYSIFNTMNDAQIQWVSKGIGCSDSTLNGNIIVLDNASQLLTFTNGFTAINSILNTAIAGVEVMGTIDIQIRNVVDYTSGETGTLHWRKEFRTNSFFQNLNMISNAIFEPYNNNAPRYIYVYNNYEYH